MSRSILTSFVSVLVACSVITAAAWSAPADPPPASTAPPAKPAPVAPGPGGAGPVGQVTNDAQSIQNAPATPRAADAPVTPVPLESFGKVLWKTHVVVGPHQDFCIGDLFFGPGVAIDFGIIEGRRHDKLYFRTDRKIVREWDYPVFGQPQNAIDWARKFVAVFAIEDTLFAEMHATGEPALTTGLKAARMGKLFRHWVANTITEADHKEAAALGVPEDRLAGPPPERICPLGAGGG